MTLTFYLSGITTATFGIAGIFFLKFWKASRDRFFLFLCASSWLLSLERIAFLITHHILPNHEATVAHTRSWLYLFRLLAFLLIIFSVVEKNWARDRK